MGITISRLTYTNSIEQAKSHQLAIPSPLAARDLLIKGRFIYPATSDEAK
jgi:hypothetical protein